METSFPTGNGSPMPLNQVPRYCGYGMQKNPLGLVLLVPYDGCNVVQEVMPVDNL